jgi:hypothetical protein
MQQLTALSHMQAVAAAAAAQLGVPGGAPPMLGGYPMHAPPEPPPSLQQLGAVVNAGSSGSPIMRFNGDLSALAELQQQPQLAGLGGGPRLPNAGGCRRHSWAPTGMNGSSAYALLLQQQLAALGGGDGRALLGLSNPAAAYGHHQPPNGLGQASGYGGDAGLLNGSGPASGAFAALSTVVANNMCGLQGGMLPGGYDALGEQQLAQRLLQLQQQASLAAAAAAGQRGESSYLLEALLDPGSQAGLGPSFTPPLQVNGVALDPQLLVSPFADNWDMISGPQGIAGLTPQQLGGGGVRSPTAGLPGAGMAKGAASLGLHGANGHAKALNGSCSSSSSSGSTHGGNGYVNGSSKLGSVAGLSGGAAAAGSSSNEPVSAEAALAAMVASLPPPPKVCSDAPWDLKKAAEEDAKVVAAQQQQVDKLLRALQRSKTLQRVEAASGAGAAAADGSQAADIGSDQQVLFGYKLPDAGADAWGGAAASAAVESAPGSGCISQDPSNKLFVGNIGWWVTEEDLLHWFSRFGAVVNVKVRRCGVVLVGCWQSGYAQTAVGVGAAEPCCFADAPAAAACRCPHTHNPKTDHVQLPQDAQAQGQVAQPRVWLHRLCHARGGGQGHRVDGRRGAARPHEGHVRHHRAVRQANQRRQRQRRAGRRHQRHQRRGSRGALSHAAAQPASRRDLTSAAGGLRSVCACMYQAP